MVAQTFNPSIREAETSRALRVQGQLGLCGELQDSQGYKDMRPCLKRKGGRKKYNHQSYFIPQMQTPWWGILSVTNGSSAPELAGFGGK